MNGREFADLRMAAERAARRIMLILGRGRVTLTLENDKGPTQKVQAEVSAKETMDVIRQAEFGFTSRIPAGGDVTIVFLNPMAWRSPLTTRSIGSSWQTTASPRFLTPSVCPLSWGKTA
jgi:hypothetical protein